MQTADNPHAELLEALANTDKKGESLLNFTWNSFRDKISRQVFAGQQPNSACRMHHSWPFWLGQKHSAGCHPVILGRTNDQMQNSAASLQQNSHVRPYKCGCGPRTPWTPGLWLHRQGLSCPNSDKDCDISPESLSKISNIFTFPQQQECLRACRSRHKEEGEGQNS